MFTQADIISRYSRAQAIEDGVLVDVSDMAQEAGFRFPVAVTQAVWADVVTPTEEDRSYGQSEDGRLWDVLWMLKCAIPTTSDPQELHYKLLVSRGRKKHLVQLKALCGPGDDAEPVITIMKPDED